MNLKRVTVAYIISSFTAIISGVVAVKLLNWWGVRLELEQTVAAWWLVLIGIPSAIWASSYLGRTLGHRPAPRIDIVSGRGIPVGGGVLADTVKLALAHKPRQSFAVADELAFRVGPVVLSESEMDTFLRGAWRRQLHGDAPLSRRYWLARGRMGKGEYEATVRILEACNMIRGQRRQGTKNTLRWPPAETLKQLRHRYV